MPHAAPHHAGALAEAAHAAAAAAVADSVRRGAAVACPPQASGEGPHGAGGGRIQGAEVRVARRDEPRDVACCMARRATVQ